MRAESVRPPQLQLGAIENCSGKEGYVRIPKLGPTDTVLTM
jgi:hypothetical protein